MSELTAEQALIEQIKEWSDSQLIGDDCALLPGQQLFCIDSLIEGTHFLTTMMSYEDIGFKSVAVNLSDIAAMAGRPCYLLVSLTIPQKLGLEKFKRIYKGILDCASTYRSKVVGGDLTSGPVLMLSIAVLGDAHPSGCLFRSGAKVGDIVVVTGDFGGSAAGLWFLKNCRVSPSLPPEFQHCLSAFLRPKPRLKEAWSLTSQTAGTGALIDASDGLADALLQITRASKVGMEIDLERVPIHEQTRKLANLAEVDPYDWALYGGEDYQLVACLPEKIWDNWEPQPGNPFVNIGFVTSTGTVKVKQGKRSGPELDLGKAFQQITF